jgi:molybdopterin/thiamine biosynthesis adenylyltransferase
VSSDIHDADRFNATILDPDDLDDRLILEGLRADPRIDFVDRWHEQEASVGRLRRSPDAELTGERRRWAYYPWRRVVASVLGPRAFRVARLDRNRNLITSEEQDRLGALRIGVVGLSVGHAVAYALAAQGLCGELRLADFDDIDLSNLNRVPASVLDLGVNKATVAARRIAELDPYQPVQVLTSGLTPHNIDDFLDGLDVVVEECDSLDIKILLREAARARGLPVLMATSDRGLVDVERYDLEARRPILHGLLGDVDVAGLAGLTDRDKIPHVLRILDGAELSPRGAASLIEVGHTLSTWPQLAADVAVGAAAIAEAVRRIGLGEDLPSGRVRIDIAGALSHPEHPTPTNGDLAAGSEHTDPVAPVNPVEAIAAAAIRAPSGGNAQPWHVDTAEGCVTIRLAPEYTSTMDIGFRGSAVAVGAAAYNARVAAAAYGVLGTVHFDESDERSPLRAVVRLGHGENAELARLYEPMLLRETNRHHGSPGSIDTKTIGSLQSAARREGGRLRLLITRDEIHKAAQIFAAADRTRYLTPRLHAEMAAELRWPEDGCAESGIDVRSLGLDPGELLTLDILRRPEVMAQLAEWDTGGALVADTRARVSASAALAVLSVHGETLTDYARGGSAVEAVWIAAQQHGLAVQPIAPVFLYARNHDELRDLSSVFAQSLHDLQCSLRQLAATGPDESQVLVLRLFNAPRTSVRSRRNRHRIHSCPS